MLSSFVCRFATKNGVTDTSRIVEDFIANSTIPYHEYSSWWIEKGYLRACTTDSADTNRLFWSG